MDNSKCNKQVSYMVVCRMIRYMGQGGSGMSREEEVGLRQGPQGDDNINCVLLLLVKSGPCKYVR